MKKWIFSLAMLLVFPLNSRTAQEMELLHAPAPQSFSANEKGYVDPTLVESPVLEVKPMKVTGFSGKALEKLETAFSVLEEVMNSEELKSRILNFKNTKGERAFASNEGLSNEEIYLKLMGGGEDLQPATVGEMNYFLKLYNNPFSKVIGYTSPTTNLIHINWKFFKNFHPSDVAGNLAHEWIHKMGFDHVSAKEHDSVPYAVGYMVREMSARLLLARELH